MNFFFLNVALNASYIYTFLDQITIWSTDNLLGIVLKIVILQVIK